MNRFYQQPKNAEYLAYVQIFKGTATEDLEKALDLYRNERSLLKEFLLSIGFVNQPLHISALEAVLAERNPSSSHVLRS